MSFEFMNLYSLICLDTSLEETAQKWSKRLSIKCLDGGALSMNSKALQEFIRKQCLIEENGFVLVLNNDGLALHTINLTGKGISIRANFHDASTIYRRRKGGGKGQMIAKAVGLKSRVYPNVLDATAGLGKDAFVLASLGCQVALLERSPIVHALLEDGLKQARKFGLAEDSELLRILDRMKLIGGDAMDYMDAMLPAERPDVVYLDPMFPPRTKSAQVKKEMQVLHQLLDVDDGGNALLESAIKIARSRVVVKRPRVAPTLSGFEPSYTLEGKRNRFDVYTLRNDRIN